MKIIPELKETLVKFDQGRTKGGQERGTLRTDLKNIEHLHHEATLREFTVTIDEPPKNGGTNTGPNPLGYFLIGAAACFFNQVAKVVIIRDLKVDTLEMTARMHVDLAKPGGHITDLIYDVKLSGTEDKTKLEEMLHEAEGMCFVHQTLKRAIPLTSNINMNGADVTSHTLSPSSP